MPFNRRSTSLADIRFSLSTWPSDTTANTYPPLFAFSF